MRVELCDVGPRDGLQNEPEVLAPAVRAELVDRLAATGLPCVEAVSFVRPDLVPQMAGAEEVVERIRRRAGVAYCGLALNERGYDRLVATGLDRAHLTVAATDSFSRRNANATVEEATAALVRTLARAHAEGMPTAMSISVAFGCPFEGEVDPGRVLELARVAADAGAGEIAFADTIGVAVPRQVRALVEGARGLGPPIGLHLHDTRRTAVACAYAGLEAGATAFDASVGGLGGCPFAPRATGNVATEDLVYLFHREGVETGVDLDGLIGVARWISGVLGRELPGAVSRAGGFPPG
jgi:hydroxymethylglutaryl-CoA lyase/(R)-citramalyl-CoA lyase